MRAYIFHRHIEKCCQFPLQAIWYHLYEKKSAPCVGTLAHAKGFLGATNVPDVDPQKAFYPFSSLIDKITTAYVVAAGLHHFGMENVSSLPSFFYIGVPKMETTAPRSNKLVCIYCDKSYKRPSALRKHEASQHNHCDPK